MDAGPERTARGTVFAFLLVERACGYEEVDCVGYLYSPSWRVSLLGGMLVELEDLLSLTRAAFASRGAVRGSRRSAFQHDRQTKLDCRRKGGFIVS
jgi:hypothetical protein